MLGSLNQDLTVTLPRLPQPGETILGQRLATFPGGKGANQAVAAARLGGTVAMVGRVGADPAGEALVRNLQANRVDASGVARDPVEPTGSALIFVGSDGQNMIAVVGGANARVDVVDAERAAAGLGPGDVLVMQLEIPVATVQHGVAAGRRARAFVLLNAAPASRLERSVLRQLDGLVVNWQEAALLAEGAADPAAAARALRAMGPGLVAVTLGAEGSLLCDEAGVRHVPAFVVEPVDSTGAGDAFVGALALGIARRLAPESAVRFANAAGAAATTSLGAQEALPTPEMVRRLFGVDVSSFPAGA